MLMTIALVFSITWLPLNVLNIVLDLYNPFSLPEDEEKMLIIYAVCHLFGMSSACANPFLYGWFNDNFRNEFTLMLTTPIRFCFGNNDVRHRRRCCCPSTSRMMFNASSSAVVVRSAMSAPEDINAENGLRRIDQQQHRESRIDIVDESAVTSASQFTSSTLTAEVTGNHPPINLSHLSVLREEVNVLQDELSNDVKQYQSSVVLLNKPSFETHL